MDYGAPIWVYDKKEEYYINSHLEFFPFNNDVLLSLNNYQKQWEETIDIDDGLICKSLVKDLEVARKCCELKVENWLKINGWITLLDKDVVPQ